MTRLVLAVIRLYQATISAVLPTSCRFEPSCSRYAYQAIAKFGLFHGGALAAKRLARCNPLCRGGYDPVP